MAIQFQCPACQSVIQVPDEASGKKGPCPQCEAKIRVPTIEIPPQQAAPPPVAPQQPVAPTELAPRMYQQHQQPAAPEYAPPTQQAVPQQPVAPMPPQQQAPTGFDPNAAPGPFDFQDPQAAVPQAAPQQPTFPSADEAAEPININRNTVRRRRKRKGGNLMIPLVFGGLLLAGVFYLYWQSTPKLSGEITAVPVPMLEIETVIIKTAELTVAPAARDNVLEKLFKDSERLETAIMHTEVGADDDGLFLDLASGGKTRFYKISIVDNPGLKFHYDENINAIATLHEEMLIQHQNDFFNDWLNVINSGEPIQVEKMVEHRDNLLLTKLGGLLGFQLQAVVGEQHFRCVLESNDELYFLLHDNISQFQVEGRQLSDGSIPFPGRFTAVIKRP